MGYGWRSEQQRGKGIRSRFRFRYAQVRQYAQCCCARRSFLPPLRQRGAEATDVRRQVRGTGREGGYCLRYHLVSSFPSSLAFPDQDSPRSCFVSEFPALFPLVFPIWVVCFCFLPSLLLRLPSPGSLSHFSRSLLPHIGNVSHLARELDGLVQPTCFSPARPSTTTLSNQLLSAVELLCGLTISHHRGGTAVSTASLEPGASLERNNNITSTTPYPA